MHLFCTKGNKTGYTKTHVSDREVAKFSSTSWLVPAPARKVQE